MRSTRRAGPQGWLTRPAADAEVIQMKKCCNLCAVWRSSESQKRKKQTMKWRRIALAAIAVPVADMLVITLVVTVYALKLAFQAQGAPDQVRITQFAERFGRSSWFVIAAILTVPAAAWAACGALRARRLHGIAVGVIAGVAMFFPGFTLNFRALAEFALMGAAGLLGGLLADRVSRGKQSRKNHHVSTV